jgi:hypothetical protein
MKRSLHYSEKTKLTVTYRPLLKEDGDGQLPEMQSRVVEARKLLEAMRHSKDLEAEVATAVLDGRTFRDVAKDVYEDPAARFRYWIGSEQEARARVKLAARRLGARVSSIS